MSSNCLPYMVDRFAISFQSHALTLSVLICEDLWSTFGKLLSIVLGSLNECMLPPMSRFFYGYGYYIAL